jgi:hypothetical protein
MTSIDAALNAIPKSHRLPLLKEYNTIVQNYFEMKWLPSELSGGRFSEIVYCILDGLGKGTFISTLKKPRSMETACKALENNVHLCRSFQILIPRILPVLYEIRNNRNVGHIDGDIDSNEMDSFTVLTLSGWIIAEMIRVFNGVSSDEAKKLVESITKRKIPIIWSDDAIKRVLLNNIKMQDQILLLLASNNSEAKFDELALWCETRNVTYFRKNLKKLHASRFIEYRENKGEVILLPPGNIYVTELIQKITKS